jgi:4-carboxymuconolactone decarboxylase
MRLPILDPATLDEAQLKARDAAISGKRGRMPPPAEMWLYSPELANRAQALGEFIRFDTSLGAAMAELAILVTARHWSSHYEWYAHKRLALQAGLDPAIIDAIRDRRTPDFADAKARSIYDYASALHLNGVTQPLHDAMVAAWGPKGVVEVVGICGYYTLVSMTLNAFEVPLPEGETSELT